MSSEDVKRVLSAWREANAEMMGVDADSLRVGESPQLPFKVAAFVREWGADAACGIVRRAFAFPHNGRLNGAWLGDRIFNAAEMRAYHQELYQEWLSSSDGPCGRM